MNLKTNKEIEKEFDEKFPSSLSPVRPTDGKIFPLYNGFWVFQQDNDKRNLPQDIKSHISSIRLDDIERIMEWAKGYVKYTPEQLIELNKDVPSALAEQSYYEAVGITKFRDDLLSYLEQQKKLLSNEE